MSSADLYQLYRVACQYYLLGKTQQEISETENFSRSQVSRMLDRAKELGIVKIEVALPEETDEKTLIAFLEKHLGLEEVVLAPLERDLAENDGVTEAIARRAAEYLPHILKSARKAGIGWGRTVHRMSSLLEYRSSACNTDYIPLIGSAGVSEPSLQINTIIDKVAERMKGRAFYANLPAYREKNVPLTPFENKRLTTLRQYWTEIDTAVFGLGAADDASLLFDEEVSVESRRRILEERNVAGDILSQYFYNDGRLLEPDKSYHTNAFPVDRLPYLGKSVCLAGGKKKINGIIAAAKKHYFNTLITDTDTAGEIYKRIRGEILQ